MTEEQVSQAAVTSNRNDSPEQEAKIEEVQANHAIQETLGKAATEPTPENEEAMAGNIYTTNISGGPTAAEQLPPDTQMDSIHGPSIEDPQVSYLQSASKDYGKFNSNDTNVLHRKIAEL